MGNGEAKFGLKTCEPFSLVDFKPKKANFKEDHLSGCSPGVALVFIAAPPTSPPSRGITTGGRQSERGLRAERLLSSAADGSLRATGATCPSKDPKRASITGARLAATDNQSCGRLMAPTSLIGLAGRSLGKQFRPIQWQA